MQIHAHDPTLQFNAHSEEIGIELQGNSCTTSLSPQRLRTTMMKPGGVPICPCVSFQAPPLAARSNRRGVKEDVHTDDRADALQAQR